MRVRLGRKGDYAIRAVLDLAGHEGAGRRKTREIADAMAIPESYLPSILAELVAADLVTSLAGRDGGYALARPAAQISMLDVIEAAEGEIDLAQCVMTGGPCGWEHECAVHRFWSGAQDAFRDHLAGVDVAQVAAVDATLAAADPGGARG